MLCRFLVRSLILLVVGSHIAAALDCYETQGNGSVILRTCAPMVRTCVQLNVTRERHAVRWSPGAFWERRTEPNVAVYAPDHPLFNYSIILACNLDDSTWKTIHQDKVFLLKETDFSKPIYEMWSATQPLTLEQANTLYDRCERDMTADFVYPVNTYIGELTCCVDNGCNYDTDLDERTNTRNQALTLILIVLFLLFVLVLALSLCAYWCYRRRYMRIYHADKATIKPSDALPFRA